MGRFVGLWREVGGVGVWLPEVERAEGRKGGRAEGGGGTGDVVEGIDRTGLRDPVLITSILSRDPVTTLTRLKCSRVEIERGGRIGRFREEWPDSSSAVEVRRWMAKVGDSADDLVCLARVRGVADGLEKAVARVRESGAPLTVGDLAVSGEDLLAAGVTKGPMVGKTLRKLLDIVLEDPTLNTRAELLARIED